MRIKLWRNRVPHAPWVGYSYGKSAFGGEKVFTVWLGGLILVVLV